MWTEFWDMHSGGYLKELFHYCYIEAPLTEARIIFFNKFGHNPYRVTCTCCGADYSVSESPTLFEATAYQRGCYYNKQTHKYKPKPSGDSWKTYYTAPEFARRSDVRIIRKSQIKPSERIGNLPKQGYVWVD